MMTLCKVFCRGLGDSGSDLSEETVDSVHHAKCVLSLEKYEVQVQGSCSTYLDLCPVLLCAR